MGSVPPPVPPAAMPLISPNALLHAHLSQTPPLRPSQRRPTEPRPIDLNTGSLTHANGSSLVRIGATTIVCGVRAEVLNVADIPSYSAKKDRFHGEEGRKEKGEDDDDDEDLRAYNLLVPNLELNTGCSPLHPANAAPGLEAQSISQRVLSLLLSSHLVRQADLEITYTPPPPPPSSSSPLSPDEIDIDVDTETNTKVDTDQAPQLKAFWVLYIDMVCLSHGGSGSVFDAAWLALYAALGHTKLPKATWDADAKQVVCCPDVRDAVRLRLRGTPVPLSFGVFVPDKTSLPDANERARHQAAKWLVDLDAFEEETVSETGCVVVDMDKTGEAVLHRVEKSGGAGLIGLSEIKVLVGIALDRRTKWQRLLRKVSCSSTVEPG